jgi:hypothetical protein
MSVMSDIFGKLSGSNRKEHYFRLKLTENEHFIIEDSLREICEQGGLELLYYRKLKNGHVPLIREVKIKGNFGKVMEAICSLKLQECIIKPE